jgi:hypothetical protein
MMENMPKKLMKIIQVQVTNLHCLAR